MAGCHTFKLHSAAVVASASLLILIFGSNLAEAKYLFNMCAHTTYPSLCDPIVNRIATPRQATHKTIRALEAKTQLALEDAAKHKSGNQAITTCYETMSDAIYNLASARKSIRKRDVMSMNTYLTAVVSDYGACVDAFIESGQVNTVQNAVVELRKMSSNCLTLSTLIR